MKKITKLLWVTGLVMVLTGCFGNDDQQNTQVDVTTNEPQEAQTDSDEATDVDTIKTIEPAFGGTLRIASYAPKTFDPIRNDQQSVIQVLGLIYEPLFVLDETLMPIPVLVDTYSFENEGATLIIKLKDNVLFHNGVQLTSTDVAYTINKIKDSDITGYKNQVKTIKNTTLVDALTLKIYFEQGYAFALSDLTFPIISRQYVSSAEYDEMHPIGTGPYRFVNYQQMQNFDLTAYLDWHGDGPYIENIKGVIMNDSQAMETLFDQKLIDIMNPSKFNWLKYSSNEEQNITSYTSSYYDFIGFNFDRPLFLDKETRQAFAYAVNREFILYDRFINHGKMVNAPIIPGSWYATEHEPYYKYDLDLAKRLVESKYVDFDGDGFFDYADEAKQTSIELTMLVNKENSLRVHTADIIKKDFEALGFKINLDIAEPTQYYEKVVNGEFDLLYGGWKMSQVPDFGSLFSSNGQQNHIRYRSETMDQLINSITYAYTMDQLKASVNNFEAYMIEEVPYISLYFLDGAVMSGKNVYGTIHPNTEWMFHGIENLYLDF
ncbi:ABC transporter substrate-binding protein [Petrocella sp. FN5]|uniref:ABC transporter substrate-binding protein n=1 Tax=Petrocella sp. FN5 TaxID=3032002 RepID=UPI0023DCE4EB|nr:ABC transporter substrate-binding protein [Petrocella sp. FN5]MDF1618278.1 ABC transporter substrate-binding protein [Petrocella sp. FN5]